MLIGALPVCATVKASGDPFAAERALLTQGARRDTAIAWARDGEASPQARQLLAVLHRVGDYGLSERRIRTLGIDHRGGHGPAGCRARGGGDGASPPLRLIRDLHDGRADPVAAGYELSHRRARSTASPR
jgi:hypothetical protein